MVMLLIKKFTAESTEYTEERHVHHRERREHRVNFPRFGGHPVKPEGNFRREVFNEPEEKEVFS
jgi:hypothetical protein